MGLGNQSIEFLFLSEVWGFHGRDPVLLGLFSCLLPHMAWFFWRDKVGGKRDFGIVK